MQPEDNQNNSGNNNINNQSMSSLPADNSIDIDSEFNKELNAIESAQVEQAEDDTTPKQSELNPINQLKQSTIALSVEPVQSKKSNKVMIIGLIIGATLIIVGGVIVLVYIL